MKTDAKFAVGFAVTLSLIGGGIWMFHGREYFQNPPPPSIDHIHEGQLPRPFGPRELHFLYPGMSQQERQDFLEDDFTIIKDVKALPRPVFEAFLEEPGAVPMANPGKTFQVTDVVENPGLPWQRLIFAGTYNDRCFVHYEHGGIAHNYHLALFSVSTSGEMKALWSAYCDSSFSNLGDLRFAVANGRCNHPDSYSQ